MENNFCKIFIYSENSNFAIASNLALFYKLKAEGKYLKADFAELGVIKNDDFDILKGKDFPDGFLSFPYYLEINFIEDIILVDVIFQINKILSFLWSQNIPAVAACDYEDSLINNGGYNKYNLPWPG